METLSVFEFLCYPPPRFNCNFEVSQAAASADFVLFFNNLRDAAALVGLLFSNELLIV